MDPTAIRLDKVAIPEIIVSPEIGRLFEPKPERDMATNITELCDAMLEVLEIDQRERTSEKCLE